MAKKKNNTTEVTEPKRGPGQPSKYKPEFCPMLIEHMRGGHSLESFGALAECSKETLYNWLEAHEEFLAARKTGMTLLHKYYEEMGLALATGRMQRVKCEEPLVFDGKVVIDPTTGKPAMKREYELTKGSVTAWIYLTKNMIGWRDKMALTDENGDPLKIQVEAIQNMNEAELKAYVRELAQKALEE